MKNNIISIINEIDSSIIWKCKRKLSKRMTLIKRNRENHLNDNFIIKKTLY